MVRAGKFELEFGARTLIMGVLNATPDSFSGDGRGDDIEAAVRRARELVRDGAAIVDVGGESTRPGAEPISTEVECARVVPVVERLVREIDIPISVDTRSAIVAEEAIRAGAVIVNDIWGLRGDAAVAGVVARFPHVALVVMHHQRGATHSDLMAGILAGLRESVRIAAGHGISEDRIIVDPGFGFGKTPVQNIEVVRRLRELRCLGRPILIGIARKASVGAVLGGAPLDQRLEASLALTALGVAHGADAVRANDVASTARACRAADEVVHGPSPELLAMHASGRTL